MADCLFAQSAALLRDICAMYTPLGFVYVGKILPEKRSNIRALTINKSQYQTYLIFFPDSLAVENIFAK